MVSITECTEERMTEFTAGDIGLVVAHDRSCATLAIGGALVDFTATNLAQVRDLARLLASPAVLAALGFFERSIDDTRPDPAGADTLIAWLVEQFKK